MSLYDRLLTAMMKREVQLLTDPALTPKMLASAFTSACKSKKKRKKKENN